MPDLQQFIHALEEGRFANVIRWIVIAAICFFGVIMFVFDPFYKGLFKGLTHHKGMEQAAIAKQVALGNGFSTPMIRPIAVAQMKANERSLPPIHSFPDTYYGPVWPATLAPFMLLFKDKWDMAPADYVYVGDRIVTTASALFFFMGALVAYFTVRRLFDAKLGMLVVCLTLLAAIFWQYLSTGLPQLLLFFLFGLAMYTMLRAVEARLAGGKPLGWLLVSAALFGIMALTNGVTAWMFLGVLIFVGFYFPKRVPSVLAMTLVFLLVVSPWLIRNYQLTGNPLGTGYFALLHTIKGGEAEIMRGSNVKDMTLSPMHYRAKLQHGIADQLGDLYARLGGCLVAPLFFVALLHPFRRPEVRAMRWLLLLAWVFAIMGSSLSRGEDSFKQLSSTDFQLFFIPLFAAYGLAFLLVLWGRLEIPSPLARRLVILGIFLISALPIVNLATTSGGGIMVWPPYVPPYIGVLGQWATEKEIVVSDMPWAVGWYANRTSLWVPQSLETLNEMHDYDQLGAPLAGLHFSPVMSDQPLWSGIIRGSKDWIAFLMRNPNLPRNPFTYFEPLPIDGMSAYFTNDIGKARIERYKKQRN